MAVHRESLCNLKRDKPIRWIDYIDQNHRSVQEFNTYLDSLSEFDQDELLGRIDALKERASFGLIPKSSAEFENVQLYPELFELKWRHFGRVKGGALIRQYHAEPMIEPPALVALHIHLKNTKVSSAQINETQDLEISYAKLRYEAGRKTNWVI